MSSFKDFVATPQAQSLLAGGAEQAGQALTTSADASTAQVADLVALADMSNAERKKIVTKAVELLQSNDALTQISDQIGTPREGETQDEFVERASEVARKVLRKLLNAKK
jgi:hypothetical protein